MEMHRQRQIARLASVRIRGLLARLSLSLPGPPGNADDPGHAVQTQHDRIKKQRRIGMPLAFFRKLNQPLLKRHAERQHVARNRRADAGKSPPRVPCPGDDQQGAGNRQ
jgi:hypothetical protein